MRSRGRSSRPARRCNGCRDALGIVGSAGEATALAAEADPEQAVYLVPAFVGLGAPYWRSEARATITGVTRGTTRKELARAALEAVGYQTHDLIDAMRADAAAAGFAAADAALRVDGGMSVSDWTMQFLADILDMPVDRPASPETTALGAGYVAGWRAGLYPDPESFAKFWRRERRFDPHMTGGERARRLRGWRDAVARTLLNA